MTAPRFLPVLLAFCMFSTGASGLVNEYVLATITTYILGNSIENFSMVIACMMLMMGVSGFVQNKIVAIGIIGECLHELQHARNVLHEFVQEIAIPETLYDPHVGLQDALS